jgi:hypothetical protein
MRLVAFAAMTMIMCIQGNARADQNGQGTATPAGPGVDLTATSKGNTTGISSGGREPGQLITCGDVPLASLHDLGLPNPGSLGGTTTDGTVVPPGTPGTWVFRSCAYPDGGLTFGGVAFVPASAAGDPVRLMQQARNHLDLPPPPVVFSPAATHWQYVQMPTWAWVPRDRWVPLTASASAGPVSVTVVATPVRLVFTYQVRGDGRSESVSCAGPGTPYSDQLAADESPRLPVLAASPDCGWTWHYSSGDSSDERYAVSARTVYHVVWSVQGAAGGGDLGQLSGRSIDFRVTVGEIQALNIPTP